MLAFGALRSCPVDRVRHRLTYILGPSRPRERFDRIADMSQQRNKPGVIVWVVLTAIAMAVYGGAYWALLDPNPQWDKTETVYLSGPGGEGGYIDVPAEGARPVPNYHFVGRIGKSIFSPAHWVDSQLRRMKWAARPIGEPVP